MPPSRLIRTRIYHYAPTRSPAASRRLTTKYGSAGIPPAGSCCERRFVDLFADVFAGADCSSRRAVSIRVDGGRSNRPASDGEVKTAGRQRFVASSGGAETGEQQIPRRRSGDLLTTSTAFRPKELRVVARPGIRPAAPWPSTRSGCGQQEAEGKMPTRRRCVRPYCARHQGSAGMLFQPRPLSQAQGTKPAQ